MKYIFLSLLLLVSGLSAKSLVEQKIEDHFIENIILPALLPKSSEADPECNLGLAGQCFTILHEVFSDCKQSIEEHGKDISADIVCLKALWNLKNSNVKECLSCACEFSQFVKVKLPICSKEELIKAGVNLFEQVVAQNL